MEFHQLRYFCAIADSGGFSRAALLSDLEAVRSAVAEGSASITGSVCVGVIPTIAPYFLPPLLATFSRRHPQARVTVVEEIAPLLPDTRARVSDIPVDRGKALRRASQAARPGKAAKRHARRAA